MKQIKREQTMCIELSVQTFNMLPARQRKTEGTKRLAVVNGQWREVKLVAQPTPRSKWATHLCSN
jgi:hypothetical protein